ncbi:MAG: rod shape-determining protein RodA [Rhodothermia bacterium]|nr:MAG: rod shape-determining protein RodA [Rhodothermia bacterium]
MRTWYTNLDFLSIFLWCSLVIFGLAAIYSTTNGSASEFLLETVRDNYNRQLLWFGVSGLGLIIALLLPVRVYQHAAFPVYILTIALLVIALIFGREINGARSWIMIGSMQFQVSELAKVGTVLGVAHLVGLHRPKSMGIQFALLVVGMILLPAVLIVLQNDMGTALVFLGLIPIALFWSGLELNLLIILIAPAIAGYLAIVYEPAAWIFAVGLTVFMYFRTRDPKFTFVTGLFSVGTVLVATVALTQILQPHQVARILSFTDPGSEQFRLNEGFQQVQSMAAIGSGGWAGKGFMQGTQTQGVFVSEQSTDFVFSVIGEEFGFLGSILVLVLFLTLLLRLMQLGSRTKHPFGLMVAAGTVGIYLIHIFINIGMATAILPVIGIPLPFLSYGGSALLANTALLAIVISLHMRRDDFSIYGY